MSRRPLTGAVIVAIAGLLVVGTPSTGSSAPRRDPEPEHVRPTERLGLQQVPKQVTVSGSPSAYSNPVKGANPLIALTPDPEEADWAYWRSVMTKAGRSRAAVKDMERAAERKAGRAHQPLLVDEHEPDEVMGGNDRPQTAQFIPRFGTAAEKAGAARVLGNLARGAAPVRFPPVPEDNGSIPLAGDAHLGGSGSRSATSGRVGDGPHGAAEGGTGDYDFYEISDAEAGQRLVVDIDTVAGLGFEFDSVVALWNAAGEPLAANDDDGQSLDSHLAFTLPAAGDYFVSVGGFGRTPVPDDPFDPASGGTVGSEGPYEVSFGLDAEDVDYYAVRLQAGDVLGASVTGSATEMLVVDPSGRERVASAQDLSAIYPPASPLPGGGNAVLAHVAEVAGRHTIAVTGTPGTYDITLEAYRPGPPPVKGRAAQIVFLDVDGARVNTAMFGGKGVSQLSPMKAFLGRWGLTASQENAVIDQIVRTTTENLKHDFASIGVSVRVRNSRDHADPFGLPNVSRIIVGGTVAESGVPTIGIAQSIDPGNFAAAETGLVLLDILSDPSPVGSDESPSLNAYLTPASNKVRFVGTAIGNIVSHEAGHYLGSFHVDQYNAVLNVMDQGGNFPLLYGVGPDGVGGTADDWDVDFGEDVYNPLEGYRGIEDTRANTRWALTRRK